MQTSSPRSNFLRALRPGINPIIVKELRSRMRGPRAFLTLTGMLLLLGGASFGVYQLVVAMSRYSYAPVSPMIGQALFMSLIMLELFVICAITPAITAGAISGEQEKLTYEMLLTTPMRPASILWGKLISALSYLFLLLFAGVPMASLVFIFGGVTARDLIKAMLILVCVTVMTGVIGLFMSAVFRRTGRATVMSYLVVLILTIGPMVAAIAWVIMSQGQQQPPRWMLVPSPLAALTSAIQPGNGMDMMGSIFGYMAVQAWNVMGAPISQTGIPRPLYHYSLPFFALLTLVLYLLATRLVQPTRRWRFSRRDVLVGVAAVGVLLVAIAGFLAATGDTYETFTDLLPQPTPDPRLFGGPVNMGMGMPMPAQVVEAVQVEEAPDVTPTPTPASIEGGVLESTPVPLVSAGDQAAVYSAALHYLLTQSLGPQNNPAPEGAEQRPLVYILTQTNANPRDPSFVPLDSMAIPPEVQDTILANLAELPYEFRWAEGRDAIPYEDDGQTPANGAAILVISNIQVIPSGGSDQTVTISVSRFAGLGQDYYNTYTLTKNGNGWQVIQAIQ